MRRRASFPKKQSNPFCLNLNTRALIPVNIARILLLFQSFCFSNSATYCITFSSILSVTVQTSISAASLSLGTFFSKLSINYCVTRILPLNFLLSLMPPPGAFKQVNSIPNTKSPFLCAFTIIQKTVLPLELFLG